MDFARSIWKLLVGVKDALALAFLLLFFLMLYGVLSFRPSPGDVREGALLLQLDGSVVEEPRIPDPVATLLSNEELPTEYRARDLVQSLRLAARDSRIKAVVLDLSGFLGGGFVHLQDIGEAMDKVREAKKPVLVYAPLYFDDRVLLAAHASEVWVDPLGGAFISGPGGNRLYFASLLERLKVTAHVFRVGTFKSAVEPYLRNDLSPEAREADRALYGSLWGTWKADVVKARPKANIALATGDPVGWLKASGGDAARAALAAGLVDRIGDSVQFGKRVAEIVGADPFDKKPGTFAHTSLDTWQANTKDLKPGKPIAVVTIAGEIVDGDGGPGIAGGDRIAQLLDDALSQDVAALVVRVDSPGGSIQASERIRRAIERYKEKNVPVVVSMVNMAASGGYWVSTPAQRIFAEPGTITGSIGVFAVIPTFERALSEWGVTSDGTKTTPLSGQPDPVGGLSPDVSAMIQANIEYDYRHFVGLVAKARGKTPQQVDQIAQGRVWDGGTARKLGLVDEMGGFYEALAHAAKLAKLGPGQWHPAYLGESESLAGMLQHLRRGKGTDAIGERAAGWVGADWAAIAAQRQKGLIGMALQGAERMVSTHGAQAYCLECPVPTPALFHAKPLDPGVVAGLLRMLQAD